MTKFALEVGIKQIFRFFQKSCDNKWKCKSRDNPSICVQSIMLIIKEILVFVRSPEVREHVHSWAHFKGLQLKWWLG
jgi:hypothetical protein